MCCSCRPQRRDALAKNFFLVCQACAHLVGVRLPGSQWNKARHPLPPSFCPSRLNLARTRRRDWGEAIAIIAGVRQTVHVFVMCLSYSRRRFVMAFPSQKQEAFFSGHGCAFEHLGGVPARISYDNLSTAVRRNGGRPSPARTALVCLFSLVLLV
jgi:hypothetical protein